ncbi:hypothetical protein A8L34_27710 [Bacillus sp. FJAT-27264]|uniref:hypothetical protein n=1 Tax=Paenibacillus sp. (strain DSM 101736 / FJAT-27264) TaxID=1850362 RepID=UPI000807FDEA|nr:hypothetical protein [Bacillus sp. FJAT-27264]OBZ15838.1 hypothetical protein A8L34_27710 [Bacillus sp. FJAT-27264]
MTINSKMTVYFLSALIYVFTPDIFAAVHASRFFERGEVSFGLRIPTIGGAIILIVMALCERFKVKDKLAMFLSTGIGVAAVGAIVSGEFSIGSNINIGQLLWYMASSFILGLVSLLSLLALTGVLTKEHFEKWLG